MRDGSTIAFFEAPGLPPRSEVTHPAYEVFDHIALQAKDRCEVDRWAAWLQENGIPIVGPTDHNGLIYSIYFHDPRSEEHTSELQSLMRISYAVFCLKKKRHKSAS